METVCKIGQRFLGPAPIWGTGGPEFKSRRSDHSPSSFSKLPTAPRDRPIAIAEARPEFHHGWNWGTQSRATSQGKSRQREGYHVRLRIIDQPRADGVGVRRL